MVLNKTLFSIIKSKYPEVRIKSENERADIKREVVTKTTRNGGVRSFVRYNRVPGGMYGEQYVMNCPFCGDTKSRFSISYLYGTKDDETGQTIKYGVHCFNETACHQDPENRDSLWLSIELALTYSTPWSVNVSVEECEAELLHDREIGLPGQCELVCDLPGGHPARTYLINRGIDPDVIGALFGVSCIIEPHRYELLRGRILVPFNRHGRLIGWTARSINENDGGLKYMTSSSGLAGFIYGLNLASQQKVLAVVERPIDRWSIGHMGAAILTARISGSKLQRLKTAILHGGVELVLVILDPKQSQKEAVIGREHPMKRLEKQLRDSIYPIPVLPVWLPDWLDPGATHGSYFANYLGEYLEKYGYGRLSKVVTATVQRTSATAAQ